MARRLARALPAGGPRAIQLVTNADEVARHFDRVLLDQVPFATSRAINRVAFGARDQMRRKVIPKRFTVRRKWIVNRMWATASHKRQWPNVHAFVGHRDEFMIEQETGGIKRGKGGGLMQIPTREPRIGRSHRRIVPRHRWAGQVKGKAGFFTEKRVGGRIVFGRRGKRGKPKAWYFLKRQVKMKPKLTLRKTVSMYAAANYGRVFLRELEKAFETGKPR